MEYLRGDRHRPLTLSDDNEGVLMWYVLMEYLRGDCHRPLTLSDDNEGVLMWYVNASFAFHPNKR
jgi:hypothetical protein